MASSKRRTKGPASLKAIKRAGDVQAQQERLCGRGVSQLSK
jgi:hypothetical protein